MEEKGIKDEFYWIESFKAGAPEALAHFFDLHYKALCFFVEGLIGDKAESEDIVADCYLKLWKGNRQIESTQNIKGFLYVSCRNGCMDYFRKLKVKTAAQEESFRQLNQQQGQLFYEVVKTDVMEILAMELESLPDLQKQIIRLLYFERKKTDEIAQILGLSVKTVRNYKALAVESMKNSILKKGLGDALYLAILLFLTGLNKF